MTQSNRKLATSTLTAAAAAFKIAETVTVALVTVVAPATWALGPAAAMTASGQVGLWLS